MLPRLAVRSRIGLHDDHTTRRFLGGAQFWGPCSQWEGYFVKASALMEHFRHIGTWVDWDSTADRVLHGDPEAETRGVAVAWIPTNAVLKQAALEGFNVFITHEPAFYPGFEGSASAKGLIREKRALLEQMGITLLRCHDTWDRMPEVGIVDAWASFLGFDG